MNNTIHSERLDLVPLPPSFLRAVWNEDLTEAGRLLGVPVPSSFLECKDVVELRLQQLEDDPGFQPWSMRGMVLRDSNVLVGSIGFHTAPGAEYLRPYSPGGVEFGYTVEPPFRRQGYAREASLAMMRWAHEMHSVTRFVVSIRPDNTASQALAAGLGFVRIGSHIDEVDGLEDILELEFAKAVLPLSRVS